MSLYTNFKTDPKLEKDGIVLQYGENSEGKPIEITIARAGGSNQNYLRRMEVKAKPFRRQIQNDTMDRKAMEAIIREVYAETIVIGWTGVEDQDGNPMACTKENVVKLFNDLPDLFGDIQEQAQRSSLFRAYVREDDSKN